MLTKQDITRLYDLGLGTIRGLEVENGVLASGREEIFGCIFGRDSLIVALKLLTAYEYRQEEYFLHLVRKIILNLGDLQGTEENIESGEEPGKMIHEYRPDNHEHLTRDSSEPWHVYPDGTMRIYDSVDSTPLFLMAVYRYYELSGDAETVESLLSNVLAALEWLAGWSDSNGDGFADYELDPLRTHGGLRVQNWMDSVDSVFHEDGAPVARPIAPVEAQAYSYAAFRMWSDYFKSDSEELSAKLSLRADELKARFNSAFLLSTDPEVSIAFALDGNGKPLISQRSSMGHILWAAWRRKGANAPDAILRAEFIPLLAERLLAADLFDPSAGIRTLSIYSKRFEPRSYHNGSIWPHDTGMIAEGLQKFGFDAEAALVRESLLSALNTLGAPFELMTVLDGRVVAGEAENGQKACRTQAWCAATLVAESLAHLEQGVPQVIYAPDLA
jgi:glycogen debranching enzyme